MYGDSYGNQSPLHNSTLVNKNKLNIEFFYFLNNKRLDLFTELNKTILFLKRGKNKHNKLLLRIPWFTNI